MNIFHGLHRSFTATPLGTRIAGSALLAFTLIYVITESVATVQYRWYTCAECRLNEKRAKCLRWKWKETKDNACHEWFESNLSRPHEHLWIPGTDFFGADLPGYFWHDFSGFRSAAYNPDSRPIWLISPDDQLEIYRSAPDQTSAIRAFRAFYTAWHSGNHDAGNNLSGLIRCWREKNCKPNVDWDEVMAAVAGIDGEKPE